MNFFKTHKMISSPVNIVFKLKYFLERKAMLEHWQYMVLALSFSLLGGLLWAYISILYHFEFGVIAALIGLVQGFLAFLYMKEEGDPRLIFYSFVFSIMSFFLGKYLMFVHYYDWVIGGVIDKKSVDFSLVLFYLRAISYDSIGDFLNFYKEHFDFYDILWLTIITASSIEYKFFYSQYDNNQKPSNGPTTSRRRIRRRFS